MNKIKVGVTEVVGEDLKEFLTTLGNVLDTNEICNRIPEKFKCLEETYVRLNHEITFPTGTEDKYPIPVVMHIGYPIEQLIGLVMDSNTLICNKFWLEIIDPADLINLIKYSSMITKGVEF